MTTSKTLNEEIKALKIFSLNGSNFLGTVNKGENGELTVENTVTVTVADFKGVVKNWIKAKNLNKLEKFDVDGNNNTLVTKDFTEQQLMVIDIVASEAAYAIKYALANLQNDAMDEN